MTELGLELRLAPPAWAPALSGPLALTPADLYSAEPGEEEPAWVQTERDQFRDFRDLNKDGHLDGREVGHWVLPPAQDQPLVEANHLLHESDTDKVLLGRAEARGVGEGGGGRGCSLVGASDPELGLEPRGALFGWRKRQRDQGRGQGLVEQRSQGEDRDPRNQETGTQRERVRDPESPA